MHEKTIEEIELFKIWRYISNQISWKDYIQMYLDDGWVVYNIDCEAKINLNSPLTDKKHKDTIV